MPRRRTSRATPQVAFVPGSGDLPPRNAADIAWSEYNHHWSGLFVLAIGLLSLLNQAGLRWARHWPLLFLGLAGVPVPALRSRGLAARRDRLLRELPRRRGAAASRVRRADRRVRASSNGGCAPARDVKPWARLVFPLLCAGGGTLLLTHSHAIANVKDQLLIELTHTPLALTGHRRRLGALAGTAARSANQPGRLAHRGLALAGVLRPGRPDAAGLSRGVMRIAYAGAMTSDAVVPPPRVLSKCSAALIASARRRLSARPVPIPSNRRAAPDSAW